MELSKDDVKTLAEVFNLLMAAKIDGVTGNQLIPAGNVVQRFQDIITNLAQAANDQGDANETE